PEIKAFGCCHEVFNTQNLLASMCKEKLGVEQIDRHEIHTNVMGLNHFTWFSHASYEGIDLFPLYREFVDEHYETGYPKNFDGYLTDVFACAHKVKFDLFKKYGLIAAAGDRHLAEFMPPIYLKVLETAHSYGFTLTSVDFRIEDLNKRTERSKRLLNGEETLNYTPSGEEGILLIKSLVGLERTVSNVNLPNIGQIPNLPLGTVVETNAVFEKDHIAPVIAGNVPDNIRELIMPHVQNQKDIMEGALSYNKEQVFRAFLNDPLMTINEKDARTLFEEMLENTKAYLPNEWFR
ncbi:MAG TPA: alpha-glucosidase/alpha-galactosidase, partial [Mobilitalea sp.]|nr:alpha-glucosidase/alpha-galactosidase [Mobilitalea sp.]